MRLAFLLPPMMLLAACGQGEDKKDQPEVSINAGDGKAGVHVSAGKDGSRVQIGGDGVGIDMKLPDFVDLDIEGDFDIDGVKLYPGSNVTTVNVDASDKDGAGKATVKLGFTSPAAPARAADWMGGEFAKKNIQVQRAGDTLRGTTKDGEAFTITFLPDGANAKGEVLITKS